MTRCTAVYRISCIAPIALAAIFVTLAGFAINAPSVHANEAGLETADAAVEVLPQESAPESDSGPEANLPYLFAVFIITWAAFFAYVFVMSRRQNELRQEIDALRKRLTGSEGGAPPRAD